MLFKQSVKRQVLGVQRLLQCLCGSFAIALGAQISIPFVPIPLTLQTMAVLFVVSMLGSKGGTIAVLLYLLEGIMGLPVFAGFSSGIWRILSPTGGYLLGFVPAVYFSGTLLHRYHNRSFGAIFLAGLVGILITFVWGYLQLAYFVGFSRAYTLGIVPFYAADLLKLLIFSLWIWTFKKTKK
ncbi:MAG: biotin transporter BioY [Streptococcaceae bacterium]|jgi:biotin transport system substrate-specific component|nr:biotin transporter BioY [Streptococcaceae bacterium]